jgi:1-acyl-sn-glycerol-3-phosphate acyltransferase
MQQCLSDAWYDAAFSFSMAAMTLGFSLRMEGRQRIPRTGPVLLIANHQCWFDPVVVSMAAPRRLYPLARKTLFANRVLGWLIGSLGATPVDQEGIAKEGLKTVLSELKAGRAVLIFPEGQRTWDGNLQPLKPGILLLIRRAPAPIVPVGIAGAFYAQPRWKRFPTLSPLFLPPGKGTVAVAVGRPIDGAALAGMPREDVLAFLFKQIETVQRRAEQIRRKA